MSLILQNINIINVDERKINYNQDIRIKDGIITQIGKVSPQETDKVIDGTDKFAIPGLIDAHIHFFQSSGVFTRPDIVDARQIRSYKDETASIKASVKEIFLRYLSCGITSVVDCGGPFWNYEVKALADTLPDKAPRVAVAGPLLSTVSREILDLGDPPIIKMESFEHAKKLVHDNAVKNPAFIKFWFIFLPQSFEDDSKLVEDGIKESKRQGLRVAVHATELETAKRAIKYGADILVHSVGSEPVDDEFIELAKKNNIVYIPTLIVSQRYVETFNFKTTLNNYEQIMGDPSFFLALRQLKKVDPELKKTIMGPSKARMSRDPSQMNIIAKENLKKLFEAGVFIASGTDAGNTGTLHGPSLHRELEVMVEAGMDTFSVLKSSTINAARVLGQEKVGLIKEGYAADLVILHKNPIENISYTTTIRQVIRNGVVLTSDTLYSPITQSDVVDKQIQAYNKHDLEGFLATYDPEIQLFDLKSNSCLVNGLQEMRKHYQDFFEVNPKVHVTITNKIVEGNTVIYHEEITALTDGKTTATNPIVIFEVINQLITRVWFSH